MSDKTNATISVNAQAWERVQKWANEAKKTNPNVYSPSNIVTVLMLEFLKQVSNDPDLQALDEAIEKAAKQAAKRKN